MFFWPNGKMYAGEWHAGMKHGEQKNVVSYFDGNKQTF